ncbi:MAG TPA: ATP-binding protein [Methylomirabilota bacterium]|jgi:signal transduction histidine kinase/ActR/RegA family two-component response regulator|nr:ATP-binding protein [Methylomirabilota bacterium]
MSLDAREPLDLPGAFGTVLDALVEPVLVVNPAGLVEQVNAAAAHLLGARADVGKPIGAHLERVRTRTASGDPLPPPLHPIARALAQRQAVIGAELHLEIDGRSLTCLVNVVPLPAAAGERPGRVLAIFHDITEAARLERELASQAARLEAVVNLVDEGISVVDGSNTVVFVNEAGRRMLDHTEGMTLDERIQPHYFDLDGRPLPPSAHPSSRALRGESVVGVGLLFDHPDSGRRQLRASAHPLRGPGGRVEAALLIWKDVTDQEKAREDLEGARETAEQASRLKDQFIAALSHELRTPLQPILGWTEVLRRHRALDEVTSRALEAIHRNIRQQVRLVDDLLDLSRIVHNKFTLRFETLDLRDAVRGAVETYEELLALKRLRFSVELPAEPVVLWGDSARLQQVTGNLISNALKFTPPGGSITLRLTTRGELAILEVEDTGEGIAPGDLPVIFEAFRQGKQTRAGGLGIGLDLVRRLTELHGGRVHVASQGTGRGACFRVELPLALRNTAPSGGDAPSRGRLVQRSILLIEDDDDTRTVLRYMLEAEGARVEAAASGAEGVTAATAGRHDVVLCDVGLPDIDGLEVARRIRAREELRSLRLIAVTGYGQMEDVRQAIEAGFDAHLIKPVNLDQLLALLQPRDSQERAAGR